MSEIRSKHKQDVKNMKKDQGLFDRIYDRSDRTAAEAIKKAYKIVKRQKAVTN